MTGALVLLISLFAAGEQAAEPRLAPAGLGRFAVFADLESVRVDDEGLRLRALQVAEPGFAVGQTAYVGGWSWWRIDCAAWTADRLDFASLREDRVEGPITPDSAPPHPIEAETPAAGIAAVACAQDRPETLSLEEAIRQGRDALAAQP